MAEEKDTLNVTRRTVIAGAAFVPIAAIAPAAQAQPVPEPRRALSATQRKTLESFLDRLCPADDLGPGAVGCGAAEYIDRQLADYLFAEKDSFIQGLTSMDAFALKSAGAPFVALTPEKRDEVLTAMDTGKATDFPNLRGFFNRARRLMLEGMFGDPHYGGNTNFAGWDLIRYPGPRLATSQDMQKMGATIAPYRKSAWGSEHGH